MPEASRDGLAGNRIYARWLVIQAMRIIEIRRHSYTKKGNARGKGSHLSAEVIALAREIGNHIGPFDIVLTSYSPRTLETAIAMGFAVDEQLDFSTPIQRLCQCPPVTISIHSTRPSHRARCAIRPRNRSSPVS
jgi:hypothetical protein